MRLVKAVDYDMGCNWKVYVDDAGRPGAMQELERAMAFSEEVQREDTAICEAVQEGLRSRTYEGGRYSVRRENGVHHFHGLLHRFVVARPTPRG